MYTLVLLSIICNVLAYKLAVHEWGTYTSMQGPNGVPMPGMHHGEEKLPEFVHSRATANKRGINPPPLPSATTPSDCYFCEVMDWKPIAGTETEVTQKLETPVLYFYSHASVNVTLTVGFPSGIITETYPRETVNIPAIGQVKKTGDGFAQWDVTVAKPLQVLNVPHVSEDNIWAPSRRVQANFVQNSLGESEKHIFYRGLGRFFGPISVKNDGNSISVENLSEEKIPAAWVLSSDGISFGTIGQLGQIDSKQTVNLAINSSTSYSLEDYISEAGFLIMGELVRAGLFPLEARAMVDTWKNSYFRNSGIRVLYISPSTYPDSLLPIDIQPQPDVLRRVLVGRVEVLLASESKKLVEAVHRLIIENEDVPEHVTFIKSLGRFAEAKIRYALSTPSLAAHLSVGTKQEQVEKWILDNLTF